MPRKVAAKMPRRGSPPTINDHPLLRVLIAEATRRGDTLATMARHLGVTYRRFAQWRGKEAEWHASRAVVEAAARYLDIPTVYVLCMCGVIGMRDFVHPGRISMREHVQRELEHLRHDRYFAGFFPEVLLAAAPAVQQFVVLLYRELSGGVVSRERPFEWMRSLQLAAMGDAQAQAELASLRSEKT